MSAPAAAVLRAVALALVVGRVACAGDPAGTRPARDWSDVQLAWRDDPRAPADLSAGADARPRYPSRRAARRAARRGRTLDGAAVGVGRPAVAGSLAGIVTAEDEPAVVVRAGRQPPIGVESTLASPFAAASPAVLSHRDQNYGDPGDAARRFDLHLPAACTGGSLPLVVWIGGDGAWSGAREPCPLLWLVERGYAVACVGYRAPEAAVFPAQLEDCRAAVATLVRDAEIWGIDPGRVCVIGRGAGGHLAALVALADPAAEVAAACAVAAPAHLSSLRPETERTTAAASRLIGGPLPEWREAAQAASPLTHASADDPPVLLVHGDGDRTVPVAQSVRLDEALRAAGVDCRLVKIAGGHELPLDADTVAGTTVLAFLDRVVGPGARARAAEDAAAP